LLLDPVLDAKQALELGLVHEVVQDDRLAERSQEVAIGLAKVARTALGGAKALLNAALFSMLVSQLERGRQRIIVQARSEEFIAYQV